MSRRDRYVYVTSNRNIPDVFAPDRTVTFYQIAQFPDAKTGRYHMRRIMYDGDSKPTEITYFYLTPEHQTLFYDNKLPYEYKVYPYYTLQDAEMPTGALLDQARSNLFTDKIYGKNFNLV